VLDVRAASEREGRVLGELVRKQALGGAEGDVYPDLASVRGRLRRAHQRQRELLVRNVSHHGRINGCEAFIGLGCCWPSAWSWALVALTRLSTRSRTHHRQRASAGPRAHLAWREEAATLRMMRLCRTTMVGAQAMRLPSTGLPISSLPT